MTRTDVLTFLSPSDARSGLTWPTRTSTRASASRPGPSTPASRPTPRPGSVVTPITLSTTFAQRSVGEHQGFEYSRSGNPTRAALEACLASLEGAAHGFAFSSGLAAEDNVLRLLRPGDRILLGNDAYGGTFRLISKVYGAVGYPWTAADLTDVDACATAGCPTPRMVWLETPTNPLLTCIDIEAVATLAHEKGALVVVDNTFATPYLQQPLALGADIVVHSATKYLGGHSDVVGGFAALDDDELAERLRFTQNAAGAVPAPFDCYLVLRGLKTLAVRMERHCTNARAVVDLLVGHPPSTACSTPSSPTTPATPRPPADAGLRRHGQLHAARRRGGRAGGRPAHRALHAGRVARRGRVADRAPGPHDPRVGRRLTPRGPGVAGAPVGRPGVGRRPRGRPRAGPRPDLTAAPVSPAG